MAVTVRAVAEVGNSCEREVNGVTPKQAVTHGRRDGAAIPDMPDSSVVPRPT